MKDQVTQKQLLDTFRALLPEQDRPKAELRPERSRVIRHILSGHDVLAIMPTGSGKSVCYQVPAMHLPGITLVVSPLQALMEDQVRKLERAGFPAACLAFGVIINRGDIYRYQDDNGEAAPKKRRRLFADIYRDRTTGYQHYKLLYVTPERLRDKRFLRFARQVDISMIAVDEAHCISQWGYDFRPSYLEISRLMGHIGYRPTIAAFTATATPVVQDDILSLLRLRKPRVVGDKPVAREKLSFSVRHFSSDREKLSALLEELRTRPGQCGYVFCARVRTVNKVYGYLRENGVNATRYFADLDEEAEPGSESKAANFQSFLDGSAPVMVCTNALGMGVDKADVRFALHYELPPCLENYYQEAGRAGRDGKQADCVLFYAPSDEAVCQGLIKSPAGGGLSARERESCQALAEERLKEMVQYAEHGPGKTGAALQEEILSYFRRSDPQTAERAAALRAETLDRLAELDKALYVNASMAAHALRRGRMAAENLKVGKDAYVSYEVTGERLDYFDLMIADAVYTLMVRRVTPIRAKGVMELLSGDRGLLLRPERREAVEARIRKMMRAKIRISRTPNAQYDIVYPAPPNERVPRDAFLPLWEEGGGFFYDPRVLPPLYELAELLGGQFFSLPAGQLRVAARRRTENTERTPRYQASRVNLSMTHYLLLHIHKTKAPKYVHGDQTASGKTVSWDGLCRALDRHPDHRHARRDDAELRKTAAVILGHLKARGVIGDFQVPPEGPIRYTPCPST